MKTIITNTNNLIVDKAKAKKITSYKEILTRYNNRRKVNRRRKAEEAQEQQAAREWEL